MRQLWSHRSDLVWSRCILMTHLEFTFRPLQGRSFVFPSVLQRKLQCFLPAKTHKSPSLRRTTSRPWRGCATTDWKASSTSCSSPSSPLSCSAPSSAACLTPGRPRGTQHPSRLLFNPLDSLIESFGEQNNAKTVPHFNFLSQRTDKTREYLHLKKLS